MTKIVDSDNSDSDSDSGGHHSDAVARLPAVKSATAGSDNDESDIDKAVTGIIAAQEFFGVAP